ncbi:hypothetical protein VHUM_02636 [Vanrija humicola]|uniref:Citrate transporter-like domain-containing protein n=1 Tax=Vanrija humicola TaxID=5417 RepID=A0A7D8Z2X5_VANHU|nr:hypothetical protein VHUM_02636 [Vanrija humicola]
MVLFTSFAYISLSLDHTGLLRYLALRVASRAGSPARLYSSLYVLFLALALGVGNDPVVLSGTPFVAYFAASTGLAPQAFAFAQFQAANLASALLVSSNPTNLVLTASFHLSFLQFSAWTALPTVAAGAVLLPVLMLTEGRRLPRRIERAEVDARAALVDPVGAVFGASVFIVTIVLLVALSAVGILEHGAAGVWCVTVPAAVLVLARDVLYDLRRGKGGEAASPPAEKAEGGSPAPAADKVEDDAGGGSAAGVANTTNAPPPPPPTPHPLHAIRAALPTTTGIVSALPLPLLPFAFSMFILVEGLDHTGWVGVWSGWWGAWARATGAAGCIFLMGVVSVLGCNVSLQSNSKSSHTALWHEYRRDSAPLAHPHALDRGRAPFPTRAVRQHPRARRRLEFWCLLVCVGVSVVAVLTPASPPRSPACSGATSSPRSSCTSRSSSLRAATRSRSA